MILTALGGLHFPIADDVFPGIPALNRVVINAAPRRKLRRIMSLVRDKFFEKIDAQLSLSYGDILEFECNFSKASELFKGFSSGSVLSQWA